MSSFPISKSFAAAVTIPHEAFAREIVRESSAQTRFSIIAMWSSSCILAVCVLFFAVSTIHWPLAGDATLMHYIGFLMDRGNVPYRDIADINLPGAYLIDYAAMHTFGGGSLAWRLFDLGLMMGGTLAMISIARPHGWFAGIFGGSLLTVIHGCDGIYELGQRDLVIAIVLLVGYAALFRATRNNSPRWMLPFGLCAGLSGIIKPTFLPFGILLLLVLIMARRNDRRPLLAFIAWGFVGWVLPILGALVFLWRMRAIFAFLGAVRGIMLYHAMLGRRPFHYLMLHSFAPLMPMVVIWACCVTKLRKGWKNWEGIALLAGCLQGLASYVLQGKGYSYQRYPFLAILLLMMSMDFVRAARRDQWLRMAGWAGIAFGTLFLAPVSVVKASRYNWRDTEFDTMLQNDLRQLGGERLSGQVQCIDTIGGCFEVLYRMRLEQSDGFVYDEFLFRPKENEVVAESRKRLWEGLQTNPPRVIIVTDDLFPSGPGNFRKLKQWPQFAVYLQQHYRLCAQRTPLHTVRWWSRAQQPHSYRIYCMDQQGHASGVVAQAGP
jgi:hypothetical protein